MHVLRKGGNGSYKKNQWTSRNETFYEIKKKSLDRIDRRLNTIKKICEIKDIVIEISQNETE